MEDHIDVEDEDSQVSGRQGIVAALRLNHSFSKAAKSIATASSKLLSNNLIGRVPIESTSFCYTEFAINTDEELWLKRNKTVKLCLRELDIAIKNDTRELFQLFPIEDLSPEEVDRFDKAQKAAEKDRDDTEELCKVILQKKRAGAKDGDVVVTFQKAIAKVLKKKEPNKPKEPKEPKKTKTKEPVRKRKLNSRAEECCILECLSAEALERSCEICAGLFFCLDHRSHENHSLQHKKEGAVEHSGVNVLLEEEEEEEEEESESLLKKPTPSSVIHQDQGDHVEVRQLNVANIDGTDMVEMDVGGEEEEEEDDDEGKGDPLDYLKLLGSPFVHLDKKGNLHKLPSRLSGKLVLLMETTGFNIYRVKSDVDSANHTYSLQLTGNDTGYAGFRPSVVLHPEQHGCMFKRARVGVWWLLNPR